MLEVQIRGREKSYLLILQNFQTISGARPVSYPVGTKILSQW